MADTGAIIELEGLDVAFGGRDTRLHALREVGFTIRRGSTMALVGESGSGKSVTSLALMGFLAATPRCRPEPCGFAPQTRTRQSISCVLTGPRGAASEGDTWP